MTESMIQRKNRLIGPGVFAAIAVGVLIIVAVVLWLMLVSSPREDQAPSTTSASATPPVAARAAVTEFLHYQQRHRAAEAMALNHAYTSNGLRRLAAALESLSERDGNHDAAVKQQLAQLRQQADSIQADPHATTHAATIRAAFTGAADLITTLQQQQYPRLDAQAAQVRRAAAAIDPAQLTLEQKSQVGAFFAQAGEMLRAMNQAHS